MRANHNLALAALRENTVVSNVSKILKNKWIPVSLHLNIKNNQIDLKYDDKDTTMIVPLQGTEDITVLFGKSPYFPPFNMVINQP